MAEKIATRESYGSALVELAEKYDFVVMDADLAEATKTVKGKGVSFMENNAGWHGKAPNAEQFEQAKAELEAVIKEMEG